MAVAWWIRALLCSRNACQTFRSKVNAEATWRECSVCRKRADYVTREALHRLRETKERMDRIEANLQRRMDEAVADD